MRRYAYDITIGGTHYDFTKIADSSSFQYVTPLCSNDKKSGNGTASVVLKGGANATWYQSFMQALLSAQQNKVYGDCEVAVIDNNTMKVIHRGWLNMDELSISSASFPDQFVLASKDKMQMLDTKIRYNQLWENESRVQIVSDLIDMLNNQLGMNVPYLSSELSAVDTVDHFCVAEGREETYRSVIDTLLFEATGYVLWYDANADGFRIIEIPTTVDPLETYRVVKYRLENKLVTQSAVYANDGILLAYPTIVERPNTNVYNEDIDVSISDDNEVIGQTVASGDYFPTDGDVKEIYQEYSVPDRAYIAKESRLENADLQLLYAKDVSYRLDSQPALSIAPALPNVNWDGTAHFYPDRARILFKNNNVGDSNVVTFTLTGTAVYIESLNKFTVPDNCTKPEEYTVQTITDAVKAKAFADWYYNSRRYGCTMSKWAEPEGYSTLGEIVMVQHKDTGVQMPHVIVQITDSCAGGQSGTIRLKEVVAISLYGWQNVITQTVPQTAKPNVQKPEASKWLSGTVLEGQTTARGVSGKKGDYYLNTETGDVYKCILEGTQYTALWQWVMNVKGADADLEGYTYEIQYALSDSDTEFHFPDANFGYTDGDYGAIDPDDDLDFEYSFKDYDWSTTTDGWYRGLFVWTRIKTTDKDGNITYGDPTYNKDLTQSLLQSCMIEIVSEPPAYESNQRLPSMQYLNMYFKSIGYLGTLTITTDTGNFCHYDSNNNLVVDGNQLVLSVDGTTIIGSYFLEIAYTQKNDITLLGNLVDFLGYTDNTQTIISATKVVNTVVQLTTVLTKEDLPSALNFSQIQQQDIEIGNNLIFGDYIIVEYFQIAPDENGHYEEAYNPNRVYYTRQVVGDVVSMQVATIVGDFDGTTTYYRYAPHPYMFDGYDWVSDESLVKPYVKVNTVDEVVGLARNKYQQDPSIDYHECLYAYEGYISNLTVGILNVGDIFANNIESNNYSEDGNGNPTQGYKLEYKGGQNQQGLIKSVGGLFVDMNVRGALKLWKDDTETVGADIEHPALTTISEVMADDPTGVTVNTPAIAWVSDRFLNAVNSLTRDSVVTAQGTFGNKTLSRCVYASNLNTVIQSAQTQTKTANQTTNGYSESVSDTFTVPSYIKGNIPFTVSGNASYITTYRYVSGNLYLTYYTSDVSVYINGVEVEIYAGRSSSSPQNINFTYSTTLTGGDSVYVKIWSKTESNLWNYEEAGRFTLNLSAVTIGDYVQSAGFWFEYLDGTMEQIASGMTYLQSAKALSMTSPVSFNSSSYVELRDCSAFVNYWSFVDSDGVARTLQNGRTYDITSVSLTVDGVSVVGKMLTRYSTYIGLSYQYNGNMYTVLITSTAYYNILGTIKIKETSTIGVKMMGNYPKRDADDPLGGFDCGNSAYVWENGHFKTVHYSNLDQGSARKLKENIERFDKKALDILKATEIVYYNYKKDKDKSLKIGFIADDTPEELAGKEHDKMELDHCVAVLIKAVQELSAQNDLFRQELNNLKGGKK